MTPNKDRDGIGWPVCPVCMRFIHRGFAHFMSYGACHPPCAELAKFKYRSRRQAMRFRDGWLQPDPREWVMREPEEESNIDGDGRIIVYHVTKQDREA